MTIPLSGWAEFREEMEPYIKQAYRKEITFDEFDGIVKQKIKELHEKYDKKHTELTGWLGGNYDDLGFYDDKKDAERGMMPNETLDELLDDFKGDKVKIIIEKIIEEEK